MNIIVILSLLSIVNETIMLIVSTHSKSYYNMGKLCYRTHRNVLAIWVKVKLDFSY